ncbi:MAG: selenium cofactor biosynthesis protein YqeC [Eubacteriales bacterium]|nr:selenium cofactor biosynthesis protein YqeC [Eubacteriales bacterium]
MSYVSSKFLSGLHIKPSHKRIAVVGSGGKTGLIWRLTEELVQAGKKVAVTTTTHMAMEKERSFAPDGEGAEALILRYGYVLAASIDRRKEKLCALPYEKLRELSGICDVLLVEADGARKKPFKIPMEWEPVIPEFTDLVIAVSGLDSLGQTIKEAAYRPFETALFLGKKETDVIFPEDMIRAVSDKNGLLKGVGDREYRVYLNKTDTVKEREILDRIRRELSDMDIPVFFGSLREKKKNTALIMLAAGSSRRFGENKLLYKIEGIPMYERTLSCLLKVQEEILKKTGDFCPVTVVTQYREIGEAAEKRGVKVCYNPDPDKGISSSLKIGLKANEEADSCLFTVADQPWLTWESVMGLLEVFRKSGKGMACMQSGEKRGNPCIFSKGYYNELFSLAGDVGGKRILNRYPLDVAVYQIEHGRELKDIDYMITEK